jgi:8-oxo-dGTP pyrophosphatase MutT (NUDIX family)
MDFRAFAATADTDMAGEDFHDAAPLQDTFEPPTCSYCGGTEFEQQEDNGRAVRSKCSACGGTMVSAGGTFQPDLIGSPHNHPKQDADPASGGVGGTGAGPVVLQVNDLSSKTAGADWCRHRHAEHCWLPLNDRQATVALYPPTDRGRCPWPTAQTQQVNCPMSEPGPMAGMERAASAVDPEVRWHFTAAWKDVRAKAKRIRSEGGVSIVVSSGDGIGGHVQGDTGIYETILNYAPGSAKVANWTCGCAWAAFAWGRSPAYRRFEGRMCSHALALQFEAQARGMFGKTIIDDATSPSWMRDKVRQRYDRDTGVHDLVHASLQDKLDPEGVYPTNHGLDLERPPLYAFAVVASEIGQDPALTLQIMIEHGMEHGAARELLHAALDTVYVHGALPGEKHETRCPDCGQPVSSMANKCPHCGAKLNEGETGDLHLGKKADEPLDEPTHAGVVLKAHDTGRVLMIQRSHRDPDDPAAGTWEFPGGGREEGDQHSLHSGIREFEEETGHPFPLGGHVQHVWRSANGVYQGHVVVVPSEDAVDFSNGRRTVNPDDPDGDDHEQSAWWDPEHARKNPALRQECKSAPWGNIKAATLQSKATYSANDLMSDPELGNYRPKPPQQPVNSDDENPGSTGFATAGDPPEFDQQLSTHTQTTPFAASVTVREEDLRMVRADPVAVAIEAAHRAESHAFNLDFDRRALAALTGELHDGPEPALPSTDGAEGEEPGERYRSQMVSEIPDSENSANPNSVHAARTTDEIVAAFQATAAAKALDQGKAPDTMDIAGAARAYLSGETPAGAGMSRTALKEFSFSEQQELISEGATDGTRARNLADLDITGTHYSTLQAKLDAAGESDDPESLFV